MKKYTDLLNKLPLSSLKNLLPSVSGLFSHRRASPTGRGNHPHRPSPYQIPKETLPPSEDSAKTPARYSLEALCEILSPHSAVLYMKKDVGSFEIGECISNAESLIDRGQSLRFRDGYIGWAAKVKTPVSVDDINNPRENLPYYLKPAPVKSLLVTPVVGGDELVGMLILDSLQSGAFGEREKSISSLAAAGIAAVVSESQLRRGLEAHRRRESRLLDFIEGVNSASDAEAALDCAASALAEMAGADFIAVVLREAGNESVLRRAKGTERRRDLENRRFSHERTIIEAAYKSEGAVYFDDFSLRRNYLSIFGRELDFGLDVKNIKSILACPMKVSSGVRDGAAVVGCAVLGRRWVNPFGGFEGRVAEAISQAAGRAALNCLHSAAENELGICDKVSGLYSKRYFDEALAHALARAARRPENISLMLIEADSHPLSGEKLSRITDASDGAIVSIGQVISKSFRRADVAARYGGGARFAALLQNTGAEGAAFAAKKLKRNLRVPSLNSNGKELDLTVSIGIATYPAGGTPDELIAIAEGALATAIERGGNRAVHADDAIAEGTAQ
ncbi:MAG: sensor domain-containing diguanylate cyclase [Deltaproteobacteria bacterium]